VAANEEADNHYALEQIRTVLKADIRNSTEIELPQRDGKRQG
jgi:hypothetical protein